MITIKQIFNNLPSSVEELCTVLAQTTTRPEKEEAGPKEERERETTGKIQSEKKKTCRRPRRERAKEPTRPTLPPARTGLLGFDLLI